jgi:hypothetical protein
METAQTNFAAGLVIRFGQFGKVVGIWFLQLLVLAVSYGLALTVYMLWEIRSDLWHAGLWRGLYTAAICFAAVILMAFLNFFMSGYVVTSLAANILCMTKLPRIYPFISAGLVAVHITIIRLMDHGNWGLTISFPLFVGWGVMTAFAIALFSVKRQNSPIQRVSN